MTVIIPPPLSSGDSIAVIAPAGPVDVTQLRKGERFLEQRGYRVKRGKSVLSQYRYLAGNDSRRLADLNNALASTEVGGVFFARGGYGTMRLLERIDLEPLRNSPKTLLGFSDLTPLLNHVRQRLGLVTYLGPVVAHDMSRGLNGLTLSAFESLVERKDRCFELPCRPGVAPRKARSGFLRAGCATGELAGGCLTMLAAVLGTSFQVDFRGKVLFWEEVNEPYYRIDRLLTQLRLAGALDGLSGMIVGHLTGCGAEAAGASHAPRISLRGFLDETLGDLPYPVYFGFPSGHGPEKVALPIGLPVTLDASRGRIRIGS